MKLLDGYFYKKMRAALERGFSSGEYRIPPKDDPIVVDPEARLTFVAWGDSQVSNYMFARECCFALGIEDLKNTEGRLDALVICGDIAENGFACEYRMTAELLNSVADKFSRFFGMPGNHDVRFRRYRVQLRRFTSFLSSVKNGVVPEGKYWYSADVGGYRFIVLGADRSCLEASYLGKRQLEWLKAELESAPDGKPVFVFNHQTLKGFNGLPFTWQGFGKWRGSVGMQSDRLKAILESRENVFFITGHLHFGTSEYSFEDHGAFKALAVQTVGAGNHGDCSYDAQGYVVSVYDDRVVMRARAFGEGRYIEKEIPNSEVTVFLKGGAE